VIEGMGRPRKLNREPATTISVADSLFQRIERYKKVYRLANLSDAIKGILDDNQRFHDEVEDLKYELDEKRVLLNMNNAAFTLLKRERAEMMGNMEVPPLVKLLLIKAPIQS
jgi:hypothetical protein